MLQACLLRLTVGGVVVRRPRWGNCDRCDRGDRYDILPKCPKRVEGGSVAEGQGVT